MIENKRFVIFGFPRSATKLLANVLTQAGCHNYGEWYDVWSSEVKGDRAIRISDPATIRTNQRTLTRPEVCKRTTERYSHWLTVDKHDDWTITIWPDDLRSFPFLLQSYQDCFWLCTQRNEWDQLLSWLVSKENQNYNATHTSNNVTVNKRDFQDSIDRMARAKLYQEWIVENLPSKVIQFDDLVHGTADVGYKYQVDTTDEHSNIENYITNVDEVKSWYNHAKLLAC